MKKTNGSMLRSVITVALLLCAAVPGKAQNYYVF